MVTRAVPEKHIINFFWPNVALMNLIRCLTIPHVANITPSTESLHICKTIKN